MPSVSTNTAVVAACGNNLAFEEGGKEGCKISDFTAGLSNTISIIASQTEILWTKPEDITIDMTQEKLPPQIGTEGKAFLLGFSDGSVHHVPGNVDVKSFKIALMRNGGNSSKGPEAPSD